MQTHAVWQKMLTPFQVGLAVTECRCSSLVSQSIRNGFSFFLSLFLFCFFLHEKILQPIGIKKKKHLPDPGTNDHTMKACRQIHGYIQGRSGPFVSLWLTPNKRPVFGKARHISEPERGPQAEEWRLNVIDWEERSLTSPSTHCPLLSGFIYIKETWGKGEGLQQHMHTTSESNSWRKV